MGLRRLSVGMRWTMGALAMAATAPLGLAACDSGPPLECVCQCDGARAEAGVLQPGGTAEAALTGAKGNAPATALKAVTPTPSKVATPTPAKATRTARTRPTTPTKARARAEASGAAPGSGTPMTLTDADKKEIVSAWSGFAAAASKEDLPGMQKHLTERFAGSIVRAIEKQKDRLYRGIADSLTASKAGRATVKSAGDVGGGNVDIELSFPNGHTDHLLFFKEDGAWKLNRL